MDYIDKARLKDFVYRLNYGLLFEAAQNITRFSLSAKDLFSKNLVIFPSTFDILIAPLEFNTNVIKDNRVMVVLVGYENNKLIIKEND